MMKARKENSEPPGCQRNGWLLSHAPKELSVLGEPAPRQLGEVYTMHPNEVTATSTETGCIQLVCSFREPHFLWQT